MLPKSIACVVTGSLLMCSVTTSQNTITIREGFEGSTTAFTYSTNGGVPYTVQSNKSAHTGSASFGVGQSRCTQGRCHASYTVALTIVFPQPVALSSVSLWAREGSTSGSGYGGQVLIEYDGMQVGYLDPILNHAPITGVWEQLNAQVDRIATSVVITVTDVTNVTEMLLDDVEIIYRVATAASFTSFGNGCLGAAGTPNLTGQSGSVPILGSSFTADLFSLPLFSSPHLLVGLSRRPTPLNLAVIGAPSCSVYVDGAITVALQNMGGTAVWTVPIPVSTTAMGVPIYVQGVVFDPGAPGGLTVSNAAEMKIGN